MTKKRDEIYTMLFNSTLLAIIMFVALSIIWGVDWQIISSVVILLLGLMFAVVIAKGANDGQERKR